MNPDDSARRMLAAWSALLGVALLVVAVVTWTAAPGLISLVVWAGGAFVADGLPADRRRP